MFKKILISGMSVGLLAGMTASVHADNLSRGFFIEHGSVAEKGTVSVDLSTSGSTHSGGIRFGLGNSEVIINSGHLTLQDIMLKGEYRGGIDMDDFDDFDDFDDLGSAVGYIRTDGVFKYSLTDVLGQDDMSLSVYGGISMYNNNKQKGGEYFNFTAGAAYSVELGSFTVATDAALIVDDYHSKTFLTVGVGGYFNSPETSYGTFKPGAELLFSSLSESTAVVALGVRWEFNERVTLDAMPIIIADDTVLSLPGQLRLNAKF